MRYLRDDSSEAREAEHVLTGGHLNAGQVSRVGNTLRRPRTPGSSVVEELLVHLEDVGFEGSPRFLGVDDLDRQVLTFVEGDVVERPVWFEDDLMNATHLAQMATWLRSLHSATETFSPRSDNSPQRPLPVAGSVWTHGDFGYANAVFRDAHLVAFIDWEFAAPADAGCDLGALLAFDVRGPRPDADDQDRRVQASRMAFESMVDGYGMDHDAAKQLPTIAAQVLEDAVALWVSRGARVADFEHLQWRANWLRSNAENFWKT
jgi:aminoglycoside phosphotransferase (APT) family kinase protein